MTNKEFAFDYAGDGFTFDGGRFVLVGYESESPGVVILSPAEGRRNGPWYWETLGPTDVITYAAGIGKYQYANLNGLAPIRKGTPRTAAPGAGPGTPGGGAACLPGVCGSGDFHNKQKKYSKMVETLIGVAAGFAAVFFVAGVAAVLWRVAEYMASRGMEEGEEYED